MGFWSSLFQLGAAAVGALTFGWLGLSRGIGWLLGSLIGSFFNRPEGTKQQRLTEIYGPSASYGDPIERIYGNARVGAKGIWKQPGYPELHERKTHPDDYYIRFAVGIAEPITAVVRVWANGEVIYDARNGGASSAIYNAANDTIVGERLVLKYNGKTCGACSVYYGSEAQNRDPIICAFEGQDATPAYRGVAYAVFHGALDGSTLHGIPNYTSPRYRGEAHGFWLKPFYNAIPTINFEVINNQTPKTYPYRWEVVPQISNSGTTISAHPAVPGDEQHFADSANGFTDFIAGQWVRSSGFDDSRNNGLWLVKEVATDGSWIWVESKDDSDPSHVLALESAGDPVVIDGSFDPMGNIGAVVEGYEESGVYLKSKDYFWWTKDGQQWEQILAPTYGAIIDRPILVLFNNTMMLGGYGPEVVLDPDKRLQFFDGVRWTYVNGYPDPFPFDSDITGYAIEVVKTVGVIDFAVFKHTIFGGEHVAIISHGNGGLFAVQLEGNYLHSYILFEGPPVDIGCGVGPRSGHTLVMFKGTLYAIGGVSLVVENSHQVLAWNEKSFNVVVQDLTNPSDPAHPTAPYGSIVRVVIDDRAEANATRMIAFCNDTDGGVVRLFESRDGSNWTEMSIDPATNIATYGSLPGIVYWRGTLWLFGGDDTNLVYRLASSEIVDYQDQNLATIIAEICEDCGLSADEYDVSDPRLQAKDVRGVVLTPSTGRDWLDTLRGGYFFDWYESMGKIWFVARGKDPVRTIAKADLSIAGDSSGAVDLFAHTMAEPKNVPERADLLYFDVNKDFEVATQTSMRKENVSVFATSVSVPMVFTADEARKVAEVLIDDAWNESRPGAIQTLFRHVDLDPTDCIVIAPGDYSYTCRVKTGTYTPPMSLRMDVVIDNASIYTQVASGSVPGGVPRKKVYPTCSVLLDIPAISKDDDYHGIYLAADMYGAGYQPEDPIAAFNLVLWISVDGGTTWIPQWTGGTRSLIGRVPTALPGGVSMNLLDTIHTLTVDTDGFPLYTVTRDQLLAGANLAFIGDPFRGEYELIRFQTATEVGGFYQLSNLIRGCYGTSGFIDSHLDNAWFILLRNHQNSPVVSRVTFPAQYMDRTFLYKVLPLGTLPSETDIASQATYTARFEQMPPTPYLQYIVGGGKKYAISFDIGWRGGTRFPVEFWASMNPLEEVERYQLALENIVGTELFYYDYLNPSTKPWLASYHNYKFEDIAKDSQQYYTQKKIYNNTHVVHMTLYQMNGERRGIGYEFTMRNA